MITTVPPPSDPMAFDALLSRSWALYRRNWIVSLPPLILIGIIVAVMAVLAVIFVVMVIKSATGIDHPSNAAIGVLVLGYFIFLVIAAIGAVWTIAATYGMADAVWERGTATLADGNAAFARRGWALVAAFIGVIGVGLVALIAALPTLFLSILAAGVFTMYVVPAVVAGGRGGFEAVVESFKLVRYHFLPSLITIVVLIAIQYAIGMVGAVGFVPIEFSAMPGSSGDLPHMPALPILFGGGAVYVISLIAGIAYSGFYAIALVGMYRTLEAQPARIPAAPAVVAPAGTSITPS